MDFEELKLTVEPYFNKLAGLDSPDEIATFLAGEEIQATPGKGKYCAIAEYFHRETGQQFFVGYYHTVTTLGYVGLGEHTDAMRAFIERFDNGFYPELEAK
jgi:hypothetical protein